MARYFQTGFEGTVLTASTSGINPDGYSSTGAVTSTDFSRTGSKSLKLTSGQLIEFGLTTQGDTYSRVYFRKTANPSSAGVIYQHGNNSSNAQIWLETNGTLTFRNVSGVQQGAASSALANDTWYLVELKTTTVNGGTHVARFEGAQLGDAITASTGSFHSGPVFSGLAGCTLYFDDCAVNNNSGSVNISWCGGGKVALLLPISDAQVGSWLTAAAGATNLYDAVNNVPPTGSAASDALRIESVDSSGNNATDEYRANMTTYTSAGVASTDDIVGILPFVCHGEEAGTGVKTGSFGLQSNPSQSYASIPQYGPSASGALGTYPSNWLWTMGTAVEYPSVTLGNSPVIAVRKTDTGTRSASVTAIYAYVDYAPHISSLVPPPPTARLMHLLAR